MRQILDTEVTDHELELEDFEYELPSHLIAPEPLPVREKSRLLIINRTSGTLKHHVFGDLPQLLSSGDMLVVNNTKVIPARLKANNANGAHIELLLLKPETTAPGHWEAMAAPLKKLKEGQRLVVESTDKQFDVHVVGFRSSCDGQRRVVLNLGSRLQVSELLSQAGYTPLPPYIKKIRNEQQRNHSDQEHDHDGDQRYDLNDQEHNNERSHNEERHYARDYDLECYQTIFAQESGAVAAPTAGLHFSQKLLKLLQERDIEIKEITLHVGPGTFKPVITTVRNHKVEEESYSISTETAAAVNEAYKQGRRIIAVGTTSCRALESTWTLEGLVPAQDAKTDLYIRPGFKFSVTTGLITNFHLSRSSLLIMVSAFAGHGLIKKAYAEAIKQEYRFYSYGDAMMIL